MVSSNGQPQHAFLEQNVVFRVREVSITFVSFKQHKGNAPETRILLGASLEVCPSAMLKDYAKHRPGQWTGPLFMWKSREQVEDAVGLSPHSFRIGVVSNAAGRGESEAQLRMMGRWSCNAYMRYVRPSQHMPLHWVSIGLGGGGALQAAP